MRSAFFLMLGLGAACAAGPTVGRIPMVPPLPETAPVAVPEPVRFADADRSAPVGESVRVGFVDAPPVYRTIVEYVDVPEVAAEPTVTPVAYGSDGWWYEGRRHGHHHEPFFPINTAVGAGVGAIIGHQSHHRGRGALIGGTFGLLLDLGRWMR